MNFGMRRLHWAGSCALIAAATLAAPALARTVSWERATGGTWWDEDNWSGTGINDWPTDDDAVRFYLNAAYTVRADGDTFNLAEFNTVASFRVEGGNVTLDISGHDAWGRPYPIKVSEDVRVSGTSGATFNLIGNGRFQTSTYAYIGRLIGESGAVIVERGGHWSMTGAATGPLGVGWGGSGSLTVRSSGTVSTEGQVRVGGAGGTLNLEGGSVTTTQGTWVETNGRLNLSGGTLETPTLQLYGRPDRLNWTGGTLRLTGQDVEVSSAGLFESNSLSMNGRSLDLGWKLTVPSGSTLLVNGGGGVSANEFYVDGGASVSVTAGNVDGGISLTLGAHGSGTASLNISGGTIRAAGYGFLVGTNTPGVVVQSGASAVTTNVLKIGSSAVNGSYTLAGGSLTADSIDTGGVNSRFVWTGGSLTLKSLTIGPGGLIGNSFTADGSRALAIASGGTGLRVTGSLTHTASDLFASSVNVDGGGVYTHSGGLLSASNVTVGAGGTYTLAGGTLAGRLSVNGGGGQFNWTGGGLRLSSGEFLVGSGGPVGSSFVIDAAKSLTMGIASEGVNVFAKLKVTGQLSQSGGAVDTRYGILEVASGGTYAISGGSADVFFANVDGNLTQTGGTLRIADPADTSGLLSIRSGGTYTLAGGTLTLPRIDRLDTGGVSSRFNWAAGTLELTGNGAALTIGPGSPLGSTLILDTGKSLSVSEMETVAGVLTQTGGTNATSILGIVAPSESPSARYDLSGGTAHVGDYLGVASSGQLNVSGGALTVRGTLRIVGGNGSGVAAANFSGGNVVVHEDFIGQPARIDVGTSVAATVTQSGNASVTAPVVYIALGTAANGSAYRMTGGTLNANVSVGHYGSGEFSALTGADVTGPVLVAGGYASAAYGRVTFADPGTTGTFSSAIKVGVVGSADLFVLDGAAVTTAGELSLAATSGKVGALIVGSRFVETATVSASRLLVGGWFDPYTNSDTPGGTGTVTLNPGGQVTISGPTKVWTAASRINLAGGTLSTGTLDLGGDAARLHWTAGTLNLTGTTGEFYIEPGGPLVSGSLTLGAGKHLITNGSMCVGNSSRGDLTISGGGTFVTNANGGSVIVANVPAGGVSGQGGSSGSHVTIDGAASAWTVNGPTGNFRVGAYTNGSLTVQNGGRFASQLAVGVGTNNIAGIGTGNGTVTVTGAGSSFDAPAGVHLGSGNAVTDAKGTLNVGPGGTVSAAAGLFVWNDASRVNLSGGTLDVGTLDVGTLEVNASTPRFAWTGGTLRVRTGTLAVNPGGLIIPDGGTLALAGARVATHALVMSGGEGPQSVSELVLTDGGRASAVSHIEVGSYGNRGRAIVDGNGSALTTSDYLFVGIGPGQQSDLGIPVQGEVVVRNGGTLSSRTGYIGTNADTGTVTVGGTGGVATWTNSGDVYVGGSEAGGTGVYAGTGTLTINTGGSVSIGTLPTDGIQVYPQGALILGGGTLRAPTMALHEAGTFSFTAGRIEVAGGELYPKGFRLDVPPAGTLAGTGTVRGGVVNGGTVSPGNSAGKLTVTDGYTQTSNGKLQVEIGGKTAGTQYDQLALSSYATASLAGTLELSRVNNFAAAARDTFTILTAGSRTGTFSSVTGLDAGNGLSFAVIYTTTGVAVTTTLAGDANLDWRVNIADFAVLQNHYNTPGTWADGDYNGDGVVNIADFAVLQNNYNRVAPGSPDGLTAGMTDADFAALAAFAEHAASVPEPGALGAAGLAAAGLLSARRRRPTRTNGKAGRH